MRVLIVAAEVAPFAKTGGLADVTAALTRALVAQGHDVKLLMPFYDALKKGKWSFRQHPRLSGLKLDFAGKSHGFSVCTAPLPKSPAEVLFLQSNELFGREGIYTWDRDEHLRFGLLSRAPMEVCQWLGWAPDVIHCNDWHTGLTPLYLRAAYAWDRLFERTRTVLTIHNIGYQGVFPSDTLGELGFGAHAHLLHQDDLRAGQLGFLKTGLIYADALTTVSETYAREIQTPAYGMGLQDVLRARADHLVGIVNGVDYAEWDPTSDIRIPQRYSPRDLTGKRICRERLLARMRLAPGATAPVLGIVSRLTAQKGFELLPGALPALLTQDVRLAVLGSGEERYEQYFHRLQATHPGKVSFWAGYDEELAHWIEAGSDFFLMPSLYEPCGLNQMYSLRYGTVPIVRRTGGLADTVQPFERATKRGTGFLFDEFTPEALLGALRRALECHADPEAMRALIQNGMAMDFSWERQAKRYVELYGRLAAR
ncbi:MAG TPA: glycogen synthase GlgA [Planctomycetota bacterium]